MAALEFLTAPACTGQYCVRRSTTGEALQRQRLCSEISSGLQFNWPVCKTMQQQHMQQLQQQVGGRSKSGLVVRGQGKAGGDSEGCCVKVTGSW